MPKKLIMGPAFLKHFIRCLPHSLSGTLSNEDSDADDDGKEQ